MDWMFVTKCRNADMDGCQKRRPAKLFQYEGVTTPIKNMLFQVDMVRRIAQFSD